MAEVMIDSSAASSSPERVAGVAAEWRDRVADATAHSTPLRLRGGGTKDWYGEQLVGNVFDTRAYEGIVAYDPAELVITARCGTALSQVEATLAEHGQMLAFEPPHFGESTTLGGCVAAGLAGPRRAYAGAPRDFMLGTVLMDGRGKILRFGGQVMKNVAGYDVARLMAGSLGTLGLVLELSLKVVPRPPVVQTIRFELDQVAALKQLDVWAGRPLPLSASAWHGGILTVRLAGAEAAVRAAHQRLGGDVMGEGEAGAFWLSLRERTHPFFVARPASCFLWRIAVPAGVPPLCWPGGEGDGGFDRDEPLVEWGGTQRWYRFMSRRGEEARIVARGAGGHATLARRGGQSAVSQIFTPLPSTLASIHRGLKAAFDPAGIFNRGRMYPDF